MILGGFALLSALPSLVAGSPGAAGLGDAAQFLQRQALAGEVEPEGESNEPARGYIYSFEVDGSDARAYEPPALLADDRGGGPWADGSHGSRAVFMASPPQGMAGMDDVVLKLKMLLMLSGSLHAVPVAGPPSSLLGGHGDLWSTSRASSWDKYVESSPPLGSEDQALCATQPVVLKEARWLGGLDDETRLALSDRSRPLCLVIGFLIFSMRPDWPGSDGTRSEEFSLLVRGHEHVQLWRSRRTMELTQSLRRLPLLQGGYNVAHVRRGDYAHPCSEALRVVDEMTRVDTTRPWLVMTNAEPKWLAEFKTAAGDAGLAYLLEGDIRDLAGNDSAMRYQTLECMYGYAEHRIISTKSLEGFCRVPGQAIETEGVNRHSICHGNGQSQGYALSW